MIMSVDFPSKNFVLRHTCVNWISAGFDKLDQQGSCLHKLFQTSVRIFYLSI